MRRRRNPVWPPKVDDADVVSSVVDVYWDDPSGDRTYFEFRSHDWKAACYWDDSTGMWTYHFQIGRSKVAERALFYDRSGDNYTGALTAANEQMIIALIYYADETVARLRTPEIKRTDRRRSRRRR